MSSISLDEYIRARAYYKNETYTQMEVMNAISSYPLVKIVRELPTDDIIDNQLYRCSRLKDVLQVRKIDKK